MQNMTSNMRKRQRGAATLLVTMVLLFSTSIVMLYLNRSILFEQKTSANQMRSTMALEMAEAGMEWATGMLNTAYDIGANCAFLGTTNVSFRRKYVQTQWGNGTPTATDVAPATTTYPGCKVDGNATTCSCPAVPSGGGSATAALGTAVLPGFTAVFSATSDPEAVRIVVTGCTAQAGACTPATTGASDATATVSSILKLRPLLRAAPASPLTCGTSCAVGGSYNVVNRDVVTGGILVNAGGAITQGPGTSYASIPGQPGANALVSNDASLSAISSADPTCSSSSMFTAYFGSTIAQYAASPTTKTIANCGSASACGSLVDAAYAAGWRAFYFPDGFARNSSSGSLGTASDPVTLVSAAGFNVTGNIDIYGMIFSNSANVNDVGTGTANIHGAMVTCAGYNNNGNGTLEYDADVLKGVRRSSGSVVRVPGSWTDRCTASTANPPVITCN
ncbi:PilX N-terminal domain-containing pilus assembly protein [Rhodoferax sp.]|uniref:pilus assembly PilX family protein n=1 Tax=Rhodoferax sp. TaxID=50421 RepID=UPI00276D1608|nr:PilX N-terminal domain-containing pilus assembly protein [Rhodoferax sp.]